MERDTIGLTFHSEKVYFLDGDFPFVALLEKELSGFNIQTRHFLTLEAGLEEIKITPPDILILDPGQIGCGDFEIIKELRLVPELNSVPFLACSDSRPEEIVIKSLDFGCDDYLVKPVKIREAASRIKGLLRRKKMPVSFNTEERFSTGQIEINLMTREVIRKGKKYKLTSTETKLLKELAKKPGVAHARKNLIQSVWPENKFVEDQNLEVHISSLRRKIEEDPSHPIIITTLRGIGYKLKL